MAFRQLYEETFDYAFNYDFSGGFNSAKDLECIVGKVIKPIAPTITENVEDIPARFGSFYLGTNYGEKEFDIPITVQCEDKDEFNRKIHNLSAILVNSERDKDIQYPIRFNDEPDVVYYGHFTQIPAPQFISPEVYDFQVTLVFMLADPRGFLPQKRIQITSNNQTIVPAGNTEVKPIIHIVPKTDLYYFGYETNDNYVAVGYNVNEGNQLIDANGNVVDMNAKQILQVDDPCNTLATWIEAGPDTQNLKLYRGDRDGKITSTPTAIMVGKNGKGEYNWGSRGKHTYTKNGSSYDYFYGPVVIHNGLPKITPYWKMSVRLHHVKMDKRNRAMGRVEVYLLDNNGDVKGRMGIQDLAHGRMPVAYIQLGSSFDAEKNKGKYRTIIWTNGPAEQQHHSDVKHDTSVSYQITEKVKVPVKSATKTKTSAAKKKTVTKAKAKATTAKARAKAKAKVKPKKKREKRSLVLEYRNYYADKLAKMSATKKTTKKKTTAKKKTKRVVKKKRGGKSAKTDVAKPKYKTVNKKIKKILKTYSYMETDAFSNFFGEFTLERQRAENGENRWVASITRIDLDSGLPATKNKVDIKKIIVEKKFGFSLANIGAFFGKLDIAEDKINPPHIYRTDFLTLTNYREWRTDGSQDPDDKPHVIVRAGDEIVIDSTDEKVFIDGKSADKYVSWGSSFPSIIGNVPQALHFSPTPANADIYIDYVPAIK